MNRDTIIQNLKKYFSIYELVDREVYLKFKDEGWQFFDTDTLHTLLVLREGIGLPFTVNDWFWGGRYTQRGLRTNLSSLVADKTFAGILYMSGHVFGKAIDFKVKGMSSEDVRTWILQNQSKLPCKIRIEHKSISTGAPITWVHYDTKYVESNPKVYIFNVP